MSTPWFDIAIVGVLGVSALVGFIRGAAREMVTALAFVFAAIAALYGLRFTGPLGRQLIDPDWAGTVAAVVVVFLIAYATLRIIGGGLAKRVQDGHVLGLLDRTVGLGFGLVRAFVVLGAFHLAFHAATPAERLPPWMTDSATYPLTEAAGQALKTFAPRGLDMAGKLRPALEDAVREGTTTGGGDSVRPGSYDAAERGGLDDLVEKSR
ncbi:MAG: CvpA family protein [Phenylobacterium sp.]|jgi:membrane protein required for colicin V production|uniref:CvpA family protein n=1 Tax=Phenylobacterium sp. TaxID=1871053 RepID=UPI0039199368